ncbi:MAG: DUF5011 domain-containing protein [Bacteroidetes bacterium]|nr:DUF5011 domain-containing protein [Bacteroidota bacterium]
MKNKFSLGLAGILLIVLAFYGCSKDDTTSPVISLNGDATVIISKGDTYTDAGAIANDEEDGTVDVTSTFSATNPDVDAPGIYTITYTAYDKAGNVSTSSRKVIVNWRGSDLASAAFTNAEFDSVVGSSFNIYDTSAATLTDTTADEFTFYFNPIFQHTITDNITCNIVNGTGISVPPQYPLGPNSSILVESVGEGTITRVSGHFVLDFTVRVTQIPNIVVYCKVHAYN